METFVLVLHNSDDYDGELITVRTSNIVRAVEMAQFMYPNQLVSIPSELYDVKEELQKCYELV